MRESPLPKPWRRLQPEACSGDRWNPPSPAGFLTAKLPARRDGGLHLFVSPLPRERPASTPRKRRTLHGRERQRVDAGSAVHSPDLTFLPVRGKTTFCVFGCMIPVRTRDLSGRLSDGWRGDQPLVHRVVFAAIEAPGRLELRAAMGTD